MALMASPEVVLLDEPSTGMDPGAKRFLWGLIRSHVSQSGELQHVAHMKQSACGWV